MGKGSKKKGGKKDKGSDKQHLIAKYGVRHWKARREFMKFVKTLGMSSSWMCMNKGMKILQSRDLSYDSQADLLYKLMKKFGWKKLKDGK